MIVWNSEYMSESIGWKEIADSVRKKRMFRRPVYTTAEDDVKCCSPVCAKEMNIVSL